jgi:hypothetical protein
MVDPDQPCFVECGEQFEVVRGEFHDVAAAVLGGAPPLDALWSPVPADRTRAPLPSAAAACRRAGAVVQGLDQVRRERCRAGENAGGRANGRPVGVGVPAARDDLADSGRVVVVARRSVDAPARGLRPALQELEAVRQGFEDGEVVRERVRVRERRA